MRKFRSITSSIDANVYVGPFGEIVVDDSNTLRLQDNVTPGGHVFVLDTGAITFNDATIGTSNVSGQITVDSNLFTVSNTIAVGNILISNSNLVSTSDVLSITANTHLFEFRDVSAPGFNVGTGAILKFDNISNSTGPTFETWYGEADNPYDPPGQHSLDIRVASAADIDYVELASNDWDNYIGVNNIDVFIHTNWTNNPEQSWRFMKTGMFVLPEQGIINSFNKISNINVTDSNVYIGTVNQNSGNQFGLLIDSGDFVFDGNVLPNGNATVDLGSPDRQWQHLYVSSNTIYIGGASLTVTNGDLLVNGMIIGGGTVYDQSLNITDNVTFNSVTSGTYVYTPEYRIGNAVVSTSAAPVTVLGAATSVVYTFDNWFTSAKFVFQTEGQLDGDFLLVDHTQTCEATVAATYNTTADPIMSVYGVVYTSVAPLATFTVRRGIGVNAGKIEILATNSQTTTDLTVKVHATQFVSRYD